MTATSVLVEQVGLAVRQTRLALTELTVRTPHS
jgi:hypothetical protein